MGGTRLPRMRWTRSRRQCDSGSRECRLNGYMKPQARRSSRLRLLSGGLLLWTDDWPVADRKVAAGCVAGRVAGGRCGLRGGADAAEIRRTLALWNDGGDTGVACV